MTWLLDITLIGLLGATLFHALRLEKALGVLKRDRAVLEELVTGFNASTRQAEQGIERLRAAADGAGRQIARQVEAAGGLKDDLLFLAERGEHLADRLDGLVRAGKHIAPDSARAGTPEYGRPEPAWPEPAAEPVRMPREPEPAFEPRSQLARPNFGRPDAPRPAPAPPLDPPVERGAGGRDPSGGREPRLRSQAERDLLHALRMAR